MNRSAGVLQSSSPVQQMMAGNPNNNNNNNNNNWLCNSINSTPPSMRPQNNSPNNFLSTTPSSNFLATYSSWHDNNQELPDSWSQLLMSGMVSEEEKKLEGWEEQMLNLVDNVKQENCVYGHDGSEDQLFQGAIPNATSWSQTQIVPPPPPSSSPTASFSNSSSSMLDFSNNNNNNKTTESRPPPPPAADPSNSEYNSSDGAGGTFKKARVHPSTTQLSTTFKVRKEKLGDRITALHQLVSPFGKTDTASVLLEAIGYIRFLQSQIEALSLPYLGSSGTGNTRHQQQPLRNNNNNNVQGEKNCLFPEDPGQLLNENCLKRKTATSEQDYEEEAKKDLKSRGLCLVPVSCTLQVGSDNGADYWAPAFGGYRPNSIYS